MTDRRTRTTRLIRSLRLLSEQVEKASKKVRADLHHGGLRHEFDRVQSVLLGRCADHASRCTADTLRTHAQTLGEDFQPPHLLRSFRRTVLHSLLQEDLPRLLWGATPDPLAVTDDPPLTWTSFLAPFALETGLVRHAVFDALQQELPMKALFAALNDAGDQALTASLERLALELECATMVSCALVLAERPPDNDRFESLEFGAVEDRDWSGVFAKNLPAIVGRELQVILDLTRRRLVIVYDHLIERHQQALSLFLLSADTQGRCLDRDDKRPPDAPAS